MLEGFCCCFVVGVVVVVLYFFFVTTEIALCNLSWFLVGRVYRNASSMNSLIPLG